MSNEEFKKDTTGLEKSKKDFGKIVKISLVFGIIAVSGLIIYYILNPDPGYVDFGLLNSNEEAEDYPTEIPANESVKFFVTVGNYLNRKFTFFVKVLKGDNDTELKDTGSEDAKLDFTTDKEVLDTGEDWISDELSVSFSKVGEGQILIVELWEIDDSKEEFFNILYLRMKVTA